MPSFPVISFNRAAMTPLQRENVRAVKVLQFVGDTEQRFLAALPVAKFALTYTDIDGASVSILRDFWEGSSFSGDGGATPNEFSLTLGSTTWNHLVFDISSDSFKITQNKPNRWSVQFQLRQTRV